MTVPIPKIDDRTYDDLRKALLAEIPLWSNPAVGPAVWDDHNVSDPGIAASEMLAAMAEVLVYRCDRIGDDTRINFLQLVLDRPEPVTTNVRFVRPTPSVDVTGIALPTFPLPLTSRFSLVAGRLEFRGVMQTSERATLLALSPGDAAYAAAIDVLFEASRRVVTIAPGTQLSGTGTTQIFETVRAAQIVPPASSVDVVARHRSLDPDPPFRLGISDGRANQAFALRTTVSGEVRPVLLDTAPVDRSLYDPNPEISVRYGTGLSAVTERWLYVRDLLEARPTDLVFTVDWLTYRVQFGDNVHGAIPVAGAEIVVTHLQRVEGRERQRDVAEINAVAQTWARSAWRPTPAALVPFPNVSVDEVNGKVIQRLPMSEAERDGLLALSTDGAYRAAIVNLFEASRLRIRNPLDETGTGPLFGAGGRHLFDIDNARERGLADLRAPERAITALDYEHLAEVEFNEQVVRDGPRIRRAHARRLNDAGTIAVIVIPEALPDEREPTPSPELLRRLYTFLDPRRLITTRVLLGPPRYVSVPMRIGVASRALERVALQNEIARRILVFLHPLFGGEDGRGWPLGRSIYRSDVFRLLYGIESVDYVWRVQLGPLATTEVFDLETLELPSVQIAAADVEVGAGP